MLKPDNDSVKERIYEDLLEAGFDEYEIEELDMVDKIFFEECTEDKLWEMTAAVQHDLDMINEDAFGG